jgi:hypothetical protein
VAALADGRGRATDAAGGRVPVRPRCHPGDVPSVASLDELHRAVADFTVEDLGLVIEPSALATARRSLDESGLLLLGEMHGVRENPLIIRALLQAFGLASLGLEWDEDLTPVIRAFLGGAGLADQLMLWSGDGRITAGHLAVLAERATVGPLDLILFDGRIWADWSWSERDEAMARRILAAAPTGTRTLVVAGNAHIPTSPTLLGVPMGAYLAQQRPGVREISISYGGGSYYNTRPASFQRTGPQRGQMRLHDQQGALVLYLPEAREAVVPQRPWPRPEGGPP